VAGDSFWWKRMDESVVALERLSAAVNKPEELERVLVELRQVLQKTSATTRRFLKGKDEAGALSDCCARQRVLGWLIECT
jgi:hypothetical protein